MNATILPLHQLYLSFIVAVLEAEKLSAALVTKGETAGMLYAMPESTTRPAAQIGYSFDDAEQKVAFGVLDQNGRRLAMECSYTEGIDDFGPALQKFLRAGRLEAPKAKRS